MTIADESLPGSAESAPNSSLSTSAARNLATTTKTPPQMQGITSRWLLRLLPWVQVSGGTYRVNRRLTYTARRRAHRFRHQRRRCRIIPEELRELPALREFTDTEVLAALGERFTQHEYAPGELIAEAGTPDDRLVLIVHGRVDRIGSGKYGEEAVLEALAGGDHLGDAPLTAAEGTWRFSYRAVTRVTVHVAAPAGRAGGRRSLPRAARPSGRGRADPAQPTNASGESAVSVASGHHGEPPLPGTFVDYDLKPREYELSVAQTVLRAHSRVGDLYSDPMNQVEEQLKLTIQALRERQENEMINNPEFGLLHNADLKQRIHTRSGPPTPDDLDDLLATVWKDPGFLLAHPQHDRRDRPGVQCSRAVSDRGRFHGAFAALLARGADLPVQQDSGDAGTDEFDSSAAHRRGKAGRRRSAPDRNS